MYMHTPGHAKHLSAADKANDLCDMAKLNGKRHGATKKLWIVNHKFSKWALGDII